MQAAPTLMLALQEDDGATPRYDRTFSGKAVNFAMPNFRCRDGDLTKGTNTSGASINGEKQVHKQPGPEILSMANNDSNNSFVTHQGQFQSRTCSMVNASLNNRFFMEDEASVQAVADERVPTKDATHYRQQCELVNIQARLHQQQACDQTSFDAIQAPAHVAPEVFGVMPTSRSGYDYCPGHHNISLNTCVLDRNGNFSEQNIDDMPQASGFHNLNCKSVVLEPMFAVYKDETDSSSSEFFDVSATATDRLQSQPFEQLPVFDVYDDDTEGFSNESVDVFAIKSKKQQIGISLGMHIQDGTSQCQASCFGTHRDVQFSEVPIYDVNGEETKGYSSENEIPRPPPPIFATASDQVKFQTSERMPESDDCSHAFVHVFESNPEQQPYEEEQQETAQFLTCISKATGTEESSACLNMVTDVLDVTLELQQQDDEKISVYLQQLRAPPSHVLVILEQREVWDPGATEFPVLFTTAVGATKLQCTNVYRSARLKILAVRFGARRALIFESAVMCYLAFGLGCTEVNAAALLVLAAPHSTVISLAKHSLILLSQDTHEQEQLPKENEQTSSYCNKEPDAGQTSACLNYNSYIFDYTLELQKALVWLQSPLFSDLQNQLQRSNTFSVWDPGIWRLMDMMLGNTAVPNLVPSGLHIHRIQLADCSALHACNLGFALLPPTQFAAKGSNNIEVAELTLRYWVFPLHQIIKQTSTGSNGIRFSEYTYTVDFLLDQWEFFNQQGVQVNDSAKQMLLFSQNCLKIWDIGTFFITFLPP